jgi:ketosteroid isomerase-like protein
MPSRERVEALIAMVEQAKFVEAIEAFYTEDATMQENQQPPRGPRSKLVEREQKTLAAHKEARTLPGSTYAVDGDTVVIRWTFVFTRKDGTSFRMEELALQRWRGDCSARCHAQIRWEGRGRGLRQRHHGPGPQFQVHRQPLRQPVWHGKIGLLQIQDVDELVPQNQGHVAARLAKPPPVFSRAVANPVLDSCRSLPRSFPADCRLVFVELPIARAG